MHIPCPDEERLMDYFEYRLSEKKRMELEEHLAACDACLDELAITKGLLRDMDRVELDPVPEDVTRSAVAMVSEPAAASPSPHKINLDRYMKHLGTRVFNFLGIKPFGGWQFAPIRGSKIAASGDLICLEVSFGKIKTEIEIEKTLDATAHIRIKPAGRTKIPPAVRITLKKGKREIASYLLDDFVLFENMPYDRYNISLFLDGDSLGTYFFEIKETRHGGK